MNEITLSRMVDALEAGDRSALYGVFTDDVSLRASLPRTDVRVTGAAETVDLMLGWFADPGDLKRVSSSVSAVDRVGHVSYRFTAGGSLVVEQHAYCTFDGDRIATIRIMCSGYQPLAAHLDAIGEGCATLTPRIASAMRGLQSGQTLSVLTDDPAAHDGVAAWSRMTGHEIVSVVTEPNGTRFELRHK